jgi:nucleotide-binding universal stress UspA family protein
MNKCILLGIDAPLSPATRQAIRTVNELVGPMTSQLRLVLVHVISVPYVTVSTMGLYASQTQQNALTVEQREEAEKTLATVRGMLQGQGLNVLRVDMCIRSGSPAEEIVRVARETQASLVIMGSRGNGLRQRLRRFFIGSKSRRVLQSASCPVMIVTAVPLRGPANLVAWYKEEITRYLQENPGGLTVFQPVEVARLFAPAGSKPEPGRKARAAAALALEHLAGEGLLCRHEVAGELRYVND